jgi:hypothetical protein
VQALSEKNQDKAHKSVSNAFAGWQNQKKFIFHDFTNKKARP